MYPMGGHRFKGTSSTGPFLRGPPSAALSKHAREQLADHATRLVALEERLESMTMENLHGVDAGAKRWAADALATLVLEAGDRRMVETMGSAVYAAGALEPLLLLVHHSRDERRNAGLRALAAISPHCVGLKPEHTHEVSLMLTKVAEDAEIGLPRCWAVESLYTLLGADEGATLRLPSLADTHTVAASLCEAVEQCSDTTIRSAAAAALGLSLLCKGDRELAKAMVNEEKGLSPFQMLDPNYHSDEQPSSDETASSEESSDEDIMSVSSVHAVVTRRQGVMALLGLLSSKTKSGDKEQDWRCGGAACRAISVIAAESAELRRTMGTLKRGDMLQTLVRTAIEAERATESERERKRAQALPRLDDGMPPAPPIQPSTGVASLLLWSVSAIAALATDCVENQLALVLAKGKGLTEQAMVALLVRILNSGTAEEFPGSPALVEHAAMGIAALAQNVDETKVNVMKERAAPVLVMLLELSAGQPPATRAAAARAIKALSRNATNHKMIFIQLGVVPGLVRCVQGPRADGEALKLAAGGALQCLATNNPRGMRAIIRDGGKVALRLTQRLARAQQQHPSNAESSSAPAGELHAVGPVGFGGVSSVAAAPPAPRSVTWDVPEGGTGVTARMAKRAMTLEDLEKPSDLSAPFPNRASHEPAPQKALDLVNGNTAWQAHGRRKGTAGMWPSAAAAASASPRVAPSHRPPEPKVGWRTQLAGGPKVTAGGIRAAKKPVVTAPLGGEPRWISGRRGFVRGEARGRRRRWLSTENLAYANGGGQPDNMFRGNF